MINLSGIEVSSSFEVREEAHKAAYEHGFRIEMGNRGGWLGFRSTTASGEIWLAREANQGRWLVAITHSGVAAELDLGPEPIQSPGIAVWAFPALDLLYHVLTRIYKLSVSLPEAPLDRFRERTAALPRTTEAERMVVERVGQDIFRDALMDYWNGRCPLAGITDPALLRASHIVPWADCQTDALRLDVHNGLLLSSLWDAAFDAGLVSFDDEGCALRSPHLSSEAAAALALDTAQPIPLTDAHRHNLAQHRAKNGFENKEGNPAKR